MSKQTLYGAIVDSLLKRIRSHELNPGDQVPTEAELAAAFGVSRITVVRALKELEIAGHIYRVQGKGTFVSDPPTPSGTGGMTSDHRLISLVAPLDTQNDAQFPLIHSVERMCGVYGTYLTIHNSEAGEQSESTIISRLLEAQQSSGIIVYPVSSRSSIDIFSRMLIERFPFVVVDREVEGIDAPVVTMDNDKGARLAVHHLVDLGHRRIAFVAGSLHHWSSERDRYLGYCRALVEAGVTIDPALVWIDDEPKGASRPLTELHVDGYDAESEVALQYLLNLRDPPTAVIAVHDRRAAAILRAAAGIGARVPEDLSIVGFDDLPLCTRLEVPLTTVRQPFEQIGAEAVSMLHSRIENPRAPISRRRVPCELVARASTAPPAGARVPGRAPSPAGTWVPGHPPSPPCARGPGHL